MRATPIPDEALRRAREEGNAERVVIGEEDPTRDDVRPAEYLVRPSTLYPGRHTFSALVALDDRERIAVAAGHRLWLTLDGTEVPWSVDVADMDPPDAGRPRESTEVLTEQAWRQSAACKGVDPDVFHPNVSQPTTKAPKGTYGKRAEREIAFAKSYCAICPVQSECLNYALTTNQEHGVWGNTDERQRRTLRRNRRAS